MLRAAWQALLAGDPNVVRAKDSGGDRSAGGDFFLPAQADAR
jgi:hypothetical protein